MKTKIFLDTNVVLDLLGERKPYYESVAKIASLAQKEEVILFISALTYSTVKNILSQFESVEIVKSKLKSFKTLCEITELDEKIINEDLNSNHVNFEYSLQYYSALYSDCNIIITRNRTAFTTAEIPVMTAEEYLHSIYKK
jgi:predicted nucleic acid-binding protein